MAKPSHQFVWKWWMPRARRGADSLIQFSVSGDGTLAGVGNGDPASHEGNLANRRRAFGGLAMVLVRASGRSGAIAIRAQSRGLSPATIEITTGSGRRP